MGRNIRELTPVGLFLVNLRARRNITQLDMARMCGVNHSHFSNLERGRNLISERIQLAIVNGLNLSDSERAEFNFFVAKTLGRVVIETDGRPDAALESALYLQKAIDNQNRFDLKVIAHWLKRAVT